MPASCCYPSISESRTHELCFTWHSIDNEDDNIFITKMAKHQTRQRRIRHTLSNCFTFTYLRPRPPADPATPQIRPFRWIITSCYLPQEYHAQTLQKQSPWYLLLRCMLTDLPGQLENGIGTPWRDHQLKDTRESKALAPSHSGIHSDMRCSAFSKLRWGRRIVFSELSKDEPQYLTGRWLISAYLWSESREWLQNVDVRSLITFDNATCIRGLEKASCNICPSPRPEFKIFYQLDQLLGEPKPALLSHASHPCCRNNSAIPPGAPIPQRLSKLGQLMDKEARTLLYSNY
ncbi:hypothetical protein B0T25DRAFT_549989 [Lasiosphaeria hispida]|uniref:Uncharacterized protein n=1 Tax=Lasiosphaeria hispida TaxID=260671 RepID=A0AAJ0MD15_9PEZI|nr:hypothetical protein B0T25DRAFT_549989 [Lasiosphaeria hispida]